MFIINISECLFLLSVAHTYWIHFSDMVNKISFSNINCNLGEKRRRRGRKEEEEEEKEWEGRRRREKRERREKEVGEGGGRRRWEKGEEGEGWEKKGREGARMKGKQRLVHTCCTGLFKPINLHGCKQAC